MYDSIGYHLPTYKVSDNISVTNNDLIAVLCLLNFSPMEKLSEGCLYSRTILKELLKINKRNSR